MAITQQQLQQNIQGQLPVIPNNGNPGGAYNMQQAAPAPQQAPPNPLAWLEPSESMAGIKQILEQQAQRLAATLPPPAMPQQQAPATQQIPQNFNPQMDLPQAQQGPVLPQQLVLPQRTA